MEDLNHPPSQTLSMIIYFENIGMEKHMRYRIPFSQLLGDASWFLVSTSTVAAQHGSKRLIVDVPTWGRWGWPESPWLAPCNLPTTEDPMPVT